MHRLIRAVSITCVSNCLSLPRASSTVFTMLHRVDPHHLPRLVWRGLTGIEIRAYLCGSGCAEDPYLHTSRKERKNERERPRDRERKRDERRWTSIDRLCKRCSKRVRLLTGSVMVTISSLIQRSYVARTIAFISNEMIKSSNQCLERRTLASIGVGSMLQLFI